MVGGPTREETGAKRPKRIVRPVRRSGGGAIQMVVGLLLALTIFGVIYVVLQRSGLGNYEYLSEYQRTVKKIRQAELMNKDDVWIKIHALPRKKITDPVLLQLDAAWIEYATVIRDSDDMRGAEIEARIGKLESEVLKRLGATPQQ